MALRGISAYMANVYDRGASDPTKQLASLLNNPTVNSKLLRKAYGTLESKTGKKYLSRPETAESSSLSSANSVDYTEVSDKLRESTAALTDASVKLLNADKMSGSELAENVKAYVSSYNDTVNNLKKSDNLLAISSGNSLTANTGAFSYPLAKAGITVNEDNTLTLDERVMNDDSDSVRALFKGAYSYGAKAAIKASDLQSFARLSGNSGTGIYSRYGMN